MHKHERNESRSPAESFRWTTGSFNWTIRGAQLDKILSSRRLEPEGDDLCRAGMQGDKGTIDRRRVPSFDERLAIIGRQIRFYYHLNRLDARWLELARRLAGAEPGSRGSS